MKISIKVKTGSRRPRVEKISRSKYLVWVKSAPEKGKANREAVKLLAGFFGIAPSMIMISRGFKSKIKIVDIIKKQSRKQKK